MPHNNIINANHFSTSHSFLEKNNSLSVNEYLMKQFDIPDIMQTMTFNSCGSENVILSEANNIEDVLNTVNENQGSSETLHTLQKILGLHPKLSEDFLETMRKHESYPIFIENVGRNIAELDVKTTCKLFFIMGTLGQDIRSPIMTKLFVKIQRNFDKIDLECLTLVFAGIMEGQYLNSSKVYFSSFTMSRQFQQIFQQFKNFVDEAETPKDVQKLVYCISYMNVPSPEDIFLYFVSKCDKLIDEGTFDPRKATTAEELDDILDCVTYIVNLGYKFDKSIYKDNGFYIKCLQLMDGYIDKLSPAQCVILSKVAEKTGKPPQIYNELIKTLKFLANEETYTKVNQNISGLLSDLSISNESHQTYMENLEEALGNTREKYSSRWKIISRGPLNENTIEKRKSLLNHVLTVYKDNIGELTKFSHKYLKTVSAFQNEDFNMKLEEIFLDYITSSPIIDMDRFGKQAYFLLRFNNVGHPQQLHNENLPLPFGFNKKLMDVIPQMNVANMKRICGFHYLRKTKSSEMDMHINKSYQSAMKSQILSLLANDVTRLDTQDLLKLLSIAIQWSKFFKKNEHLKVKQTLNDLVPKSCSKSTAALSLLARTLSKRNPNFDYPELVEFCVENCLQIGNLHTNKLFNVAEAFFHASSPEICKEKSDRFLSMVASSFVRDFDSISAKKAMKLATILARYHHLPHEIITKIFNEEFINQNHTFSFHKNTPMVNFHLSMQQLNKTICAIYPEYNLRWHYEQFCVEFHDKHYAFRNKVNTGVYKVLLSLVGGNPKCVRENVVSPLWQKINFEMAYDKKSQRFCSLNDNDEIKQSYKKSKIKESPEHIEHIAVRTHFYDKYNAYTGKLRDYSDLDSHCLECEGYKVIDISPYEWNVPRANKFEKDNLRKKYLHTLFKAQNITLKPLSKKRDRKPSGRSIFDDVIF